MSIFKPITHWFQKRFATLGGAQIAREQIQRYNALMGADPDRVVAAITAFDCGTLAPLARLVEAYERRDDKMMTCSMKMRASVGRCDYSIQPKEGREGDERTVRHVEILKKFWSGVTATSAFARNERGGLGLLKKQMMAAQSYGFAVHEIVWKPLDDGSLSATFVQVPLWHFENHTGELRFLKSMHDYEGVKMVPGEWLVTTGDGIGIAACLCACIKRLTLADWAVFCERCGMPLIVGKTGAAYGSDQWNNLNDALAAIGRDARIQIDSGSDVSAINVGGGASQPYTPLVEWADKSIAALYRGADLSTISSSDATGASLQGDESNMLEQDACNRLAETLREQVERFVIRYTAGDDEPLAQIVIEPVQKPNVDTDIKIDAHLVSMGAKLSKKDALQRYGRTEVNPDDAEDTPLQQVQNSVPQPANGLFNEQKSAASLQRPLQAVAKREEEFSATTDADSGDASQRAILAAFTKDTSDAADAIRELLADPSPEKAEALLADLPSLIPDDPALAAVIADAMAAEFGRAPSVKTDGLANENPYHCPKCGKFSGFNGHCDKCGYTLNEDETQKRAKRLMKNIFNGDMSKPIDALAYRDGLGQIDLDVGKLGVGKAMEHGKGISKINQKHGDEFASIPHALAHGKIYRVKPGNDPEKPFDDSQRAIVDGTHVVFLDRKGNARWTIASVYDDVKKVEKIERAAAK